MQPSKMRNVTIPLTRTNTGRTTEGRLYGGGPRAVILSNMNTNDQDEWRPLLDPLLSKGFMVLTYDYIDPRSDQWEVLEDALTFIRSQGAERIVLIGASRGGVTSMQVLARSDTTDDVVGAAAISAPVEHEGAVFFDDEELKGIRQPKLLINCEGDECAWGTRRMYELILEPKEMTFYPGDAHGTEIFAAHGELLVPKLVGFAESRLNAPSFMAFKPGLDLGYGR